MTSIINVLHVPLLLVMALSLILFSCSKGSDNKQIKNFLFSAARQGDDETVRDLLRKGADVNTRDDNGCTPLSIAASRGNLSIVKLLLEGDADVNVPCKNGENALTLATSRGYEAIVRSLLEIGADVNGTDQQGRYALSYAIEAAHAGIVKALIEHGAEINVKYSYETPLIHAARRGRTEIVKVLLDRGADVRATDLNSMSALMQAIDKGYSEIAIMLIEKGSDVNIRAGNGYTPLALARSKKQERVAQALQTAGAVGPKDPFVEIAANERAKIVRVNKDLSSGGWQHFITRLNVQYYLKPSEVTSTGNGIYRISTMEFFMNADELFETVLEMDCVGNTYRHISTLQRDISGAPVKEIPVDSYVLNDKGHIQDGSAMHALFMRICAKP